MLNEQIVFMVPEGTRARLDALAKENERTISQELRLMVRERLEALEVSDGQRRIPNQPRYGDR